MIRTFVCLLTSLALTFGSIGTSVAQKKGSETKPSVSLLDRGDSGRGGFREGGAPSPSGPLTISYPGGGPGPATPSGFGATGATVFGSGAGAFLGNFFLPLGMPYPPSFLTAGGVPGFDLTGAYAFHLPLAALTVGFLGAAVVPAPSPTAAPAGPIAAGKFATVAVPFLPTTVTSALLSAPGAFAITPLRVSAASPGMFCGLLVGGPFFGPIGGAANGLGGVSGTPAQPPLRTAASPLATGGFIPPVAAPPALAYIAGCFADSSTTPVELMKFSVE